jgi:hypothetical protein
VRYVRRTVPTLPFRIGVHVDFDDLREVATITQGGRNRALVRRESIGAHLEAVVCRRVAKALNEGVSRGLRATPKREVQNEFGAPFHRYEAVGIAHAVIVPLIGALRACARS